MRILTLCYEYPPLGGGGSKVVLGLSRELARLGHEIDIVTMGYGTLARREQSDGVTVHRLRQTRRDSIICHTSEMVRHELRALPLVLSLIKKNRYDLNHSHFIFPDGVCALAAQKITGLPYIITVHGSDVPGYNPDRFISQHKLLHPLWQAVVGGAQTLVCPSRHLRSLVLARRDSANTCVIPNGLDPEKLNAERQKTLRILVVTRMFRRKGVQKLINAVKDSGLPLQIDIIGDGPYLPSLRELAEGSATPIRFWGWLDNDSKELKEIYETSCIFAFFSAGENFPINLLEAMAAGMAIVTTNETGCAEVVDDCAIKVNPDSPKEVRGALMRLAEDPTLSADLGRRARERFEQRFTWSSVAAQYDSLYRQLEADRASGQC